MRKQSLALAALGVIALLPVPVGAAAAQSRAATQALPHASSSAGGVTYGPTSKVLLSLITFSFGAHSGTITVTNGYGTTGTPEAHYQIAVKCATFLGNGLVYWGGPVTKSFPSKINEAGKWVFGYFKAGGPHHGSTAGEVVPSGTCYSATNRSLAGASFKIGTGVITVT